jgi:hypothetical protein
MTVKWKRAPTANNVAPATTTHNAHRRKVIRSSSSAKQGFDGRKIEERRILRLEGHEPLILAILEIVPQGKRVDGNRTNRTVEAGPAGSSINRRVAVVVCLATRLSELSPSKRFPCRPKPLRSDPPRRPTSGVTMFRLQSSFSPSAAKLRIVSRTRGDGRCQTATSSRNDASVQPQCNHRHPCSTQLSCGETTRGTASAGAIPAASIVGVVSRFLTRMCVFLGCG